MSTTIHAAAQTVETAIDLSKSHNEIVTIVGGQHYAALCADLSDECEDSVDAGERVEFWGADDDGVEWRVHVLDRR